MPSTLAVHGQQGVSEAEEGFFRRSIEEVARVEVRDRIAMGIGARLADRFTEATGSMLFVAVNIVWFVTWVLLNSGWVGVEPWDPYPFGGLTLAVSLEAIFLAIFVLISQNRQALQADKRAKVDLQVSMIAEQEITKLMNLVVEIHERLGIDRPNDPELDQMQQRTYVERLASAVDRASGRMDPEGAKGPDSAADTEA